MRRILIVHTRMGLGGIESSLVNLLKHLHSRGDLEVHLALWEEGGARFQDIPPSIRILTDLVPERLRTAFAASDLQSALRHLRDSDHRIQGARAVVDHTIQRLHPNPWHSMRPLSNHYDVAIAFRHNLFPPYYLIDNVSASKKLMWWHHGAYYRHGFRKHIDGLYFRKLDRIVAVSESVRTLIATLFPKLQSKISVVPNIVDESAVRALSTAKIDLALDRCRSDLLLATVARMSPEKGIDVAVRSASILKERGIKFRWFFVGDGPEFLKIRYLVNEMDLAAQCILLGNQANPYPIIAASDVYVQPSRVEAEGLATREAIILKRPVVATRIPAFESLLGHGRNGLLCNLDPASMAEAILEMSSNSALRETLASQLPEAEILNATAYSKLTQLIEE